MSSVYEKDGKFYLRYKDGKGRWRGCVSNAKTKTEARRLAAEMEAKGERERRGLPPEELSETSETIDELLTWWIATYFEGAPSYERSVGTIRRHLIGSELGASRVASITPAAIELFLPAKSKRLSPQSVNHLRGYLSRAFNTGRRAGRFSMTSPVADATRESRPRPTATSPRITSSPKSIACRSDRLRLLRICYEPTARQRITERTRLEISRQFKRFWRSGRPGSNRRQPAWERPGRGRKEFQT